MPTVKCVSSRDNPFFKELGKLAGSSRQRRKAGQTLLDGAHLLSAYLASGLLPQHLIVSGAGRRDSEVTALLEKCAAIPITQLDDALFAILSGLKSPGGIMALIAQPQPAVAPAHSRFCVLLEDVQDPGNLGSILRSAAAAGCDAAFLSPGCADVWSPKVLRAGMGGHFVLSIHEHADLFDVAAVFEGEIYATSLNAKDSLHDCRLTGNIGFAIGNEGAGLSPDMLDVARHKVTIPMPGKVESLNVAAAAAVCLFEAVRQRRGGRENI